jgi:hypothetical protein
MSKPNPTAMAIARWLRAVACRHRQAAAAKEPFFLEGLHVGGFVVDPGTLRAFAQSNLNEANLLEVLAHQVEGRAWPTEGPELWVHHMRQGRTACGREDMPSEWPDGHRFASRWDEVTCPDCLEAGGPGWLRPRTPA